MKRFIVCSLVLALVAALARSVPADTKLRVGWCAKTVSSAAAPFAIAMKMGWYKAAGIDVELVPLPGSSACTQAVATKRFRSPCRASSRSPSRSARA